MFGGFQNTWSSGLGQLTEFSGNFQKLKDGLEAGLQDSGLLGPGEVPKETDFEEGKLDGKDTGSDGQVNAQVSEAEARGEQEAAKPSLPTNNIGASSENETLQSKKEDDLEDKEESGWGGEELELEVPESDTNDLHEPLQNSQEIPNEAYRTEKLENASPRSPVTSGQNHDRIASEVGKQSSENKEQIEIAEALNGESKNNHSMPQKLSTEENTDSTKETPAGFNRRVADESAAEKPERDSSYEISMHEDQEVQLPKDTSQKEFRDLEDDPSPVSMDDTVSAISPLQENGNSDLANESEQVNGESSLVLKASSHKEDQQELDNDYQEGSLSGNENLQEVQSEPRPNGLFRQDVTENLKDGNLQSSGLPGRGEANLEEKSKDELVALIDDLKNTLQTRESQLETKFQEVANMQDVTHQLMARNEELARKASKTSEEDLKQLTDEYEARIGAAERKVYALSKERDMLKRNTEKLSSVTDLVKEKDNIIAQVMAEGEQLSKKQLAQENTIKKLRQQIKDVEVSRKELATEAMLVRKNLDETTQSKASLEEELTVARTNHQAELDSEVAHYQDLLSKARAAQAEAEGRAASSAKEGLTKKLRDAEQRNEILQDQISELQLSLERQRAAADAREDRLNKELADLERRNQEAESRHDELTGNLPDATRPLLRQIEGMQRTAEAHAEAWRAAEESLQRRLAESESQCASAVEKARLAADQMQSASRRSANIQAALDSLREEYDALQLRCDSLEEDLRVLRQREQKWTGQISELQGKIGSLEADKRDSERQYLKRLDSELQNSRRALSDAESRASVLEDRLRTAPTPSSRQNSSGPPALAGPGHKWVLVKEGEDPHVRRRENGYTSLGKAGSQFMGTTTELQTLQDELLQREDQLVSCQATIQQLEATRDSLAEELVTLSQTADQHSQAHNRLQMAEGSLQEAQQRLMACTELLGEREETILELKADIDDMKVMYREQIELVVGELTSYRSPSGAASSVHSWNPANES